MVKKFAARRAELKAIIGRSENSSEERWEAQRKLQALPRDSSPVRQRNRCRLTGPDHCRMMPLRLPNSCEVCAIGPEHSLTTIDDYSSSGFTTVSYASAMVTCTWPTCSNGTVG